MKLLNHISCAICRYSKSSIPFRELPARRAFHSTSSNQATLHPITAHGPPPSAPSPSASQYGERVDRKRKQAEMLRQGKALKANQQGKSQSPLRKRFWKDVHVKEVPEGFQVFLDSRPVRTPNKSILTIPASKPHLAHAVALEWDLLVSAHQALKQHFIPLTSMVSRADDLASEAVQGGSKTRDDIVKMVMRYLDTDTLLCWAPERTLHDAPQQDTQSLREMQVKTAQPIIGFLTSEVWPGVEIKPVMETDSIIPTAQPEITRAVIRGWVSGLPPYELAALERGVLASKSLLVAVRLLADWSEELRHLQRGERGRFGIAEAAAASTLEVKWQTDQWGEVEDTHDVDKEDLSRQLGSVVLLVSGEKS